MNRINDLHAPAPTRLLMRLAPVILGTCLFACGKVQEPPAPDASHATHSVQIKVVVPVDSPTAYLSGNLPELGPWHPAGLELTGSGTTRSALLRIPHGHMLRYRVTAGSWEREGRGPEGALLPDFTARIEGDTTLTAEIAIFRAAPVQLIDDWRGAGVEGQLVYWQNVRSEFLDEPRHVVTWLPPGYDPESDRQYKVIYTHDGQNLFDPRLAYTNIDWGIDEAMMRLVRNESIEPAIVVGIWNTPDRLAEYSPWHGAAQYARFIIEELMPRVEQEFNVLTGPEHTFVMGASMGGLVSFYLLREHPEVFGACGCLSTHFSGSEQMIEWHMGRDPSRADAMPYILRDIEAGASMAPGVRLYFDYGTEGLDAAYHEPHQLVRKWLTDQGFREGLDLRVRKFEGAGHEEAAWRARVGEQLRWMLAQQSGPMKRE